MENILHCSDTSAIGYQWKKGVAKETRFVPMHFIVKIVSASERIITSPSREYFESVYSCAQSTSLKGVLNCTRKGAGSDFPITFKGKKFERIGNGSHHIGGSPDLYVAYGTCQPF